MRRLEMRRLRYALAAVTVALVLLCVATVPALAFDRAAAENTMLRLINNARTSRGLHAVSGHAALRRAARSHSTDMLRRDYFAHSSLSGLGVSTRARRAGYGLGGWSQWSVGEVIAWGSRGLGTAEAIFDSWMHSSGHRTIILGKRWRDVGVGCSRGTYRGIGGVSMWTVDFGRRVQ
jgi:uncharacterized protein YkwD